MWLSVGLSYLKVTQSKLRKRKGGVAPPSKNEEHVLVLRTCDKDLTSYGGFQWPESGPVEALDWDPLTHEGGGLYGYLWGEGSGTQISRSPQAKWLVVQVQTEDLVVLSTCVKFRKGHVVYSGGRPGAQQFLKERDPSCRQRIGDRIFAGDYTSASVGAIGIVEVGKGSIAVTGLDGTAIADDYGSSIADHGGSAFAGRHGHALSLYRGVSTAGDHGTAISGMYGDSTAGKAGIALTGLSGQARAGEKGKIIIPWWDGSCDRLVIGYVGEDGILPDTYYKVDNQGCLCPVQDQRG